MIETRPLAATLALCILLAGPVAAQTPLGQPTATFPEDFGSIQTVRELQDGRVLVADPLSKMLFAVDMDAGTRVQVGSEGQGPEEYRQPDAVWALPGDSTLLVDLGNARLVVLGPDLSFGATLPLALTEPGPGQPLVLALPQGVDGEGSLYTRAMGSMGMGGQLPDSAGILRISRSDRSYETVASFKLGDRVRTTSGGANNQSVSISNVPLSPEDAWGATADGSLVVARAGDYHVEWFAPDGTVTRGDPVPFEPVPIGTAEKEEWVAESARSGGGIGIGMQIENGRRSMSFQRGGAGERRAIDQYQWPDEKPPFYSGRLPVDGMSRVWVRRHVDAGAASTYDVFDRSARHVATYTLDPGKRVVGFGPSSVYVVAFDEFDLTYLERYALPM
jgi:hypothetical protein